MAYQEMVREGENERSKYYHGLVDMGSNGIRFSITHLSPTTQRILPTIYLDRAAISLYDAQRSSPSSPGIIPDNTTKQVITILRRFITTCQDFSVPPNQIRIVATEATRKAGNSESFRKSIQEATGLRVELLPKEDEGKVGAYGVASSFSNVSGLVMDLGGGSTQITWMETQQNGQVSMSPVGSVSLPFGAAALTELLSEAQESESGVKELAGRIETDLKEAIKTIAIPSCILEGIPGLNLYLSGGGFRGWGFILMSSHAVNPYPIPIINGFAVMKEQFLNSSAVRTAVARQDEDTTIPDIFRVSQRRASQVPAVAFLVDCLARTLPAITKVYFCQGGVREGIHYIEMNEEVRREHPLISITRQFARGTREEVETLTNLLSAATSQIRNFDPLIINILGNNITTAVISSMYVHSSYPKDLRAGAALRSTTTGHFASVHGVTHEERAILSIILCNRYGGFSSISPTEQDFYTRMTQLLTRSMTWWCMFLGRVAAVIAHVYPAGKARTDKLKIVAQTRSTKKGLVICIDFAIKENLDDEGLKDVLRKVEKAGKKKNWVRGFGWRVKVMVNGEGYDFGSGDE